MSKKRVTRDASFDLEKSLKDLWLARFCRGFSSPKEAKKANAVRKEIARFLMAGK